MPRMRTRPRARGPPPARRARSASSGAIPLRLSPVSSLSCTTRRRCRATCSAARGAEPEVDAAPRSPPRTSASTPWSQASTGCRIRPPRAGPSPPRDRRRRATRRRPRPRHARASDHAVPVGLGLDDRHDRRRGDVGAQDAEVALERCRVDPRFAQRVVHRPRHRGPRLGDDVRDRDPRVVGHREVKGGDAAALEDVGDGAVHDEPGLPCSSLTTSISCQRTAVESPSALMSASLAANRPARERSGRSRSLGANRRSRRAGVRDTARSNEPGRRCRSRCRRSPSHHSTVTDLARLRGWSTSRPFAVANSIPKM